MTFSLDAIIFDLDGTLYSQNHDIKKEIDEKTKAFLSRYNITNPEKLERRFPSVFDALSFLSISRKEFVSSVYNDLTYTYLESNQELRQLITDIPCNKYIVSLSPNMHINKVLRAMKLSMHFKEVFSICDNLHENNKKNTYSYIITKIEKTIPDNVLCIGDSIIIDLLPAHQIGVKTFLIHNDFSIQNEFCTKQFKDINICLKYIYENFI